ncbi:MAG: cupin [Saprospiraceae bacterium]|nr:cupin [Saprospiraceae bacterium]MCB9320134.1 cupin [Lewinellaceae bacterium]
MIQHITSPTLIAAAGNKPKKIEEFFGRVNSDTTEVSIARMTSPEGWVEPVQTPEFNEYTVVLEGCLQVKTAEGVLDVRAGEAILIRGGTWVQYSTPYAGGAQYMAVCLPAFSMDTVHRE